MESWCWVPHIDIGKNMWQLSSTSLSSNVTVTFYFVPSAMNMLSLNKIGCYPRPQKEVCLMVWIMALEASHSTCCCISFQTLWVCISQHEALDASEGYHVNRLDRWLEGNVLERELCVEGGPSMGFFLWPQSSSLSEYAVPLEFSQLV